MSNNDNVRVLDSRKWTPEQALLAAMQNHEQIDEIVIYVKTKDGKHDTITANMTDAGRLLIAAKMIERRAMQCFVFTDPDGNPC